MTTPTQALIELADGERMSLVTIETAERLAGRAHRTLSTLNLEDMPEEETAKVHEAMRLLEALAEETTSRTCSAVKQQVVSDAIAEQAAARVRAAVARIQGA